MWNSPEGTGRIDKIKSGTIRATPRRLDDTLWRKKGIQQTNTFTKYDQERYRTIGTTASRDSYVSDCGDVKRRDWQLRYAAPTADARQHPGAPNKATHFPPLHFGSHPANPVRACEAAMEEERTRKVPGWIRREDARATAVPEGRYTAITPARPADAEASAARPSSLPGRAAPVGYDGWRPKMAPRAARVEAAGLPPPRPPPEAAPSEPPSVTAEAG